MNRREFIKLASFASLSTIAGLSSACRKAQDESYFKTNVVNQNFLSLDQDVQDLLVQHIKNPLQGMIAKRSLHKQADAACVVMENATGDVIGYLKTIVKDGDKDGEYDLADNQKPRNCGSTIKPLIYATALQTQSVRGDETFMDEKMSFDCPECSNGEYSPGNYGEHYTNTPLTLTEGLARSSNMLMLQVYHRIARPSLLQTIKRLGLPEPTNFNTLPLGWEISPLSLCAAYTSLANMGTGVNPRFIRKEVVNGITIEKPISKMQQTFNSDVCEYIINAMRECLTHGTGTAAKELSPFMAGKTGSSDAACAVLLSKKITSFIWIGRRDTSRDIGYTGGKLSMPLLNNVMKNLKKKRPDLFIAWNANQS